MFNALLLLCKKPCLRVLYLDPGACVGAVSAVKYFDSGYETVFLNAE